MNNINLGILGMGTVASGLIHILETNKEKIFNTLGKQFEVKKVLVNNLNKKRNVNLPQDVYTNNVDDIIKNENIDILVELIGGIYPAYEYVKTALFNKKHVVTANKALIATYGEELIKFAEENGVKLMYEASVGGGIPIINTMTENLTANEFEEIYGIINGTTNFILTQMSEKGLSFNEAVIEAQALGFAEADPSSDVDGDDAAYKLSILSNIAFGQNLTISKVLKQGITSISKFDMDYAKDLGYTIKLLASSIKKDDSLELLVQPTLIPSNHSLANVKNEFNAVIIKGNAVGEIMLYGKGAGSLPTGSSVLSDIIFIAKSIDIKSYNKKTSVKTYKIENKAYKKYYIRIDKNISKSILNTITNIFDQNDIQIQSIEKKEYDNNETIIILTELCERKNIDHTILKLKENVDLSYSILCIEDFK